MNIAQTVVDTMLECDYPQQKTTLDKLRKKTVKPRPKADTNPQGGYGAPGMMAMPTGLRE